MGRSDLIAAVPNDKKASTPEYEAFVKRYTARHEEVVCGSLFGMPCLKVGKKAFAGSFDGGLALKLGENVDAAMAIEGATAFDPSGKGRPMKGWAVVPASAKRRWSKFADQARAAIE